MAFTTLLVTVSVVAIANAGWPGWPYNNDNPFPGFAGPMMPSLRFGPLASQSSIPGRPNFGQKFPFFQLPAFPTMPSMTFPSLPSASDIANAKPGKGGTFTGVVISSTSEAKRKEDGTIVKESGSTILMNNDGVVTVKKSGNAPDISTNAPLTTPFVFAYPKIPPHNPYQFGNPGFRHSINFIDPKKIESYVPGPSETYKGSAIRSSAFSTNDNGKVNQGGRIDMVENDNGRVKKQHHTFGTPTS